MPANSAAARVTDAYRLRLAALRTHAEATSSRLWAGLDPYDLSSSYPRWLDTVVAAVTAAQTRGLTLSAGYLAAYITASTGKRATPKGIDPAEFVGKSRDGRPLAEALLPPLFTVKLAIGEGKSVDQALAAGKARAQRTIGMDTYTPAWAGLSAAMASQEGIRGWRRVTSGNACGACLGAATGAIRASEDVPEVHGGCQCTAEPVIDGILERVARPTGLDTFNALTPDAQNARFGPDKAELIRNGAPLSDLVAHSHMETEENWITERPLDAVPA